MQPRSCGDSCRPAVVSLPPPFLQYAAGGDGALPATIATTARWRAAPIVDIADAAAVAVHRDHAAVPNGAAPAPGPLAWLQQGMQHAGRQLAGAAQWFASLAPRAPPAAAQPQPQPPTLSSPPAVARVAAAPLASVTAALPSPAHARLPHARGTQPPAGPVTREDLGRATWTLLHTLAAQYPDAPSRQQQRDVRSLVDALTRVYPCAECAGHFSEIVRQHPPQVGSGRELRQWLCHVHNVVNRSLGKPTFNCTFVEARWAKLDCGEAQACDMAVGSRKKR